MVPPAPPSSSPATTAGKKKFRMSWGMKKTDFNFSAANDILGIVMLEVQKAEDLPVLRIVRSAVFSFDHIVSYFH
jgi:phosphatidylserine decarboxylase